MLDAIKAAVSRASGITIKEIEGPRRAPVDARHIAMWLERRAGMSLPAIGKAFGDRDHTTVLSAVRRVGRDAALLAQANKLTFDMGKTQ